MKEQDGFGHVPKTGPRSTLQVLGEDASGLSVPIARADDIPELGESAKAFYRDLRVGDVVLNAWASEDNPLRFGVVVDKFHRTGTLNSGPTVRCVRHDGKQDDYAIHGRTRLAVIGHVPITETLEALLRASDRSGTPQAGNPAEEYSGERGPKDAPKPSLP